MTSKAPGRSSGQRFEFLVQEQSQRLDRLIARELESRSDPTHPSPARSQIAAWITDGRVTVEGEVQRKAGFSPKRGSRVSVDPPQPRELELSADATISLRIVHEEDSFLVIDKPPGLVVHPGAGRMEQTMVHGLLHHLGEELQPLGDALRPGLVHRLDKDTSGLLVVAKTEAAFRSLSAQLRPPRTMERRYLLLARNCPRSGRESEVTADGQSGRISMAIMRSPSQRTKMSVAKSGGREAVTHWKVMKAYRDAVLCEAKLETGRTHQIRLHFQAAHAPLLGDATYGASDRKTPPWLALAAKKLGRQALHAAFLSFLHPLTGQRVSFEAPLPQDFLDLLDAVESQGHQR